MKLVIIESPFSAPTKAGTEKNLTYLRACMADCLARGEAPFASHGLYTQPGVLDDKNPEERRKGIKAGFVWAQAIAYRSSDSTCAVYVDRGISEGMQEGIVNANSLRLKIEFRRLGGEWAE